MGYDRVGRGTKESAIIGVRTIARGPFLLAYHLPYCMRLSYGNGRTLSMDTAGPQ
jgi:hypothetical protein